MTRRRSKDGRDRSDLEYLRRDHTRAHRASLPLARPSRVLRSAPMPVVLRKVHRSLDTGQSQSTNRSRSILPRHVA
jgi:hypothetical protein